MSVRSDLEEATGLTIKKGEQLAAFKLRLIEAMSDEDMDAKYEAMPAASRKWYNEAVKSYKARAKLDALPDFPEEEQEQEETEQEEETEETAEEAEDESEAAEEDSDAETGDDEVTHTDVSETGRKSYRSRTSSKAKAKAAAPAPKAKSKKAAPAKGKKDGGAGKGLDYARKLLAKDIKMSATDLRDKVQAAGYEVSDNTLSTGASGFRAAVRALQTAGRLKSKMLDE